MSGLTSFKFQNTLDAANASLLVGYDKELETRIGSARYQQFKMCSRLIGNYNKDYNAAQIIFRYFRGLFFLRTVGPVTQFLEQYPTFSCSADLLNNNASGGAISVLLDARNFRKFVLRYPSDWKEIYGIPDEFKQFTPYFNWLLLAVLLSNESSLDVNIIDLSTFKEDAIYNYQRCFEEDPTAHTLCVEACKLFFN